MPENPVGPGVVTHLGVGRYALPAGGVLVPTGDYKATDPTAVEFPTLGATAVLLTLDITAQTGAGNTVTLNVEYFDQGSGAWKPLPGIAAVPTYAVGGATTNTVYIDPRITTVAGKVWQSLIPDRLRVRPVGSGTRTTLNYSIGASLCL